LQQIYFLEGKDPHGLTVEEIAAINLYTQGWIPPENSLYAILNARLRDRDRAQVKPFFLYLRLFLSALDKLPKLTVPLYRGVKKDLSKDYKQGRIIYWWGFSSCTTSMTILQSELFLGKKGARTMFCLFKSQGVDIQRYSMYKAESEVLLPPGRRLQVAAVLDQEALKIIQVEDTHDPTTSQSGTSTTKVNSSSEHGYTLKEMKQWTRVDLSEWLQDLEWSEYVSSFNQNRIDGDMFINLTEEEFKELGVTNKFHLKKLISQRKSYLDQETKNLLKSRKKKIRVV